MLGDKFQAFPVHLFPWALPKSKDLLRYLVEGIIEVNVKEVPARTLIGKKKHVLSEYKKTYQMCVVFFFSTLPLNHSGHLRILEKCRKYSPAARVFYTSLVFSNALRVLSKCNTRLTLL